MQSLTSFPVLPRLHVAAVVDLAPASVLYSHWASAGCTRLQWEGTVCPEMKTEMRRWTLTSSWHGQVVLS